MNENPADSNAISIYGQEGLDDFPVLKAFQQYIDAEQSKSRKRMIMLCVFFGFLMAVMIVAPSTNLPETFHDVRHLLVILCITVLASSLTRQLSIESVTASFEDKSTTLEILRSSVLLLILALRVCAHLNYCY